MSAAHGHAAIPEAPATVLTLDGSDGDPILLADHGHEGFRIYIGSRTAHVEIAIGRDVDDRAIDALVGAALKAARDSRRFDLARHDVEPGRIFQCGSVSRGDAATYLYTAIVTRLHARYGRR